MEAGLPLRRALPERSPEREGDFRLLVYNFLRVGQQYKTMLLSVGRITNPHN